jgi:HNH endonuclease
MECRAVTPEACFWRHVEKQQDGCWFWTGYREVLMGYGLFVSRGRRWAAHRYSYILHKGAIEPGMSICHTCDVPPCVNPDHLWQGTKVDNNLDKGIKICIRTCREHPVWALRYAYPHLLKLMARVRPGMEDILLGEARKVQEEFALAGTKRVHTSFTEAGK